MLGVLNSPAPRTFSWLTSRGDQDSFELFALTPKNSTIDKYMDMYPNDPSLGAPINSGEGVVSSGLQDKRCVPKTFQSFQTIV